MNKKNQFVRDLLWVIGCKVDSNEKAWNKAKYWILDIFIFCYFLIFAVGGTINYMIKYRDDTFEILTGLFQLSATTSSLFAYFNLIIQKYLVNEAFDEIEMIVNKREKLVNNDSYTKVAKTVEKCFKYPIATFAGGITVNSIVTMILSASKDIKKGDICTENWSSPYQFTYDRQ